MLEDLAAALQTASDRLVALKEANSGETEAQRRYDAALSALEAAKQKNLDSKNSFLNAINAVNAAVDALAGTTHPDEEE